MLTQVGAAGLAMLAISPEANEIVAIATIWIVFGVAVARPRVGSVSQRWTMTLAFFATRFGSDGKLSRRGLRQSGSRVRQVAGIA